MPLRGGRAYRQHTTFKARIRERDNNRCQLCGCTYGEWCSRHLAPVTQLDVAHIVPWPKGQSTPGNMRTVCHPCNKLEGHATVVAVRWDIG